MNNLRNMELINFIHIPKNGGTSIGDICLNNESKFRYNGHSTNVYNKIDNQLIVIRNPIDRFISSVCYALEKWSHEPQIKYLISKGIDTPENWAHIWSDPKHHEYNNLMSEMLNTNHYIGDKMHKYKWTYSPQSLWINNPKFVIVMDNFNEEIQYFMKKYQLKGDGKAYKNKTKRIEDKLSKTSLSFLRSFYKEDFIFYEKYKHMSIEERNKLK